MEFGPWVALDDQGLAAVPARAAAVQLRRAAGLVRYPTGQSAMVFYFFARSDARAALATTFADELRTPGVRGEGPLWVRWAEIDDEGAALAALFATFVARFGRAPLFHPDDPADDDA